MRRGAHRRLFKKTRGMRRINKARRGGIRL